MKGKQAWSSVFQILGACNDAVIEEIEQVDCDDRKTLLKKEGSYIKDTVECINKNIAGRTNKERYHENPDFYRARSNEYYSMNKEKRHLYYLQPEVRARCIARAKASYWKKKHIGSISV